MKKIKPSVIPGICWFLICTVLLTLPGSSFPKENWFDKIWFDKWVHIGLFAVLVFLFCWSIPKRFDKEKLNKIFIYIAVSGLFYGVIIEFIQRYFIPNRSFDSRDIIADAVGCFIGWWLALIKIGSSEKK